MSMKLTEVWASIKSGDLETAMNLCAEAEPGAERELALGALALQSGEPREAIRHARAAMVWDVGNLSALLLAAEAAMRLGDAAQSFDLAQRARWISPQSPQALRMEARASCALGRTLEGLRALLTLDALEPADAETTEVEARIFSALGSPFDAVERLEILQQRSPTLERAEAILALESSLLRLDRVYSAACAVLALDASHGQACLVAARSLEAQGRFDEAEPFWRRTRDLGGLPYEVERLQGFSLATVGAFDRANSCFLRSIEEEPRQGLAYYWYASGRRFGKEDADWLENAEAIARRRILPPEEQAPLKFALGKACDDMGDPEAAMAHFETANGLRAIHFEPAAQFKVDSFLANLESIRVVNGEVGVPTPGKPHDRPIFVLGLMRSGTTLVEQILSNHPDVAGAGEIEFWGAAAKILVAGGVPMDQTLLDNRRAAYRRLIESFSQGKSRVVDKNPANLFHAELIHYAFPDSPIVCLRRNPADIATSMWLTDASAPFLFRHDDISKVVKAGVAAADRLAARLPENRLLELQYEELVENPKPNIERLLEFCGLTWDDQCLKPARRGRPVQTISLWSAQQAVYKSSVGRWKRYKRWLPQFADLNVEELGER